MNRNLEDEEFFNAIMKDHECLSLQEQRELLADLASRCSIFSHPSISATTSANLYEEEKLPPHLSFLNPPAELYSELLLFPGSFSPWHKGHEACVLGSGERAILLIPDFNPWKEKRDTDLWGEFKELYLFTQKNKDLNLFIYTGFLAAERANPTISWLPKLPLQRKRLLMGDDTYLSVHKWKMAHELLNSIDELYVCPREGKKEDLKKQNEFLKDQYAIETHFLASHRYEHLSSSAIRSKSNLT